MSTDDCPCSPPCTSCGCSECGALETGTLGPLTLPSGRVVKACAACRGVPEVVEEKASGAQTVRLERDPSIKESGEEWAEKLSQDVA